METTTLSQSIEAILFATSEPQSVASLSARLSVPKETVRETLTHMQSLFEGHGIMLIVHEDTVTLGTRPEQSTLIETIRKEELTKELSKAAAETLAIVCYHPDATKAQIEFIRGVNASYSLRALQMRGLIEQKGSGRAISYTPTLDALRHFGVASAQELPHFQETRKKIEALLGRTEEAVEQTTEKNHGTQ